MSQEITLNVNGQTRHVNVEPDTPLLYILRNDLNLKGAKYGCGLEQCGACHVLVDGQAVPSCEIPVKNVQGLTITTIEGLGTADNLHPLQEAFIEEQAIQCGYCAAGMIIAAQGLLNRTRYPTDEDIRQELADHLCRCGVYERMRRAIKLRIGRPIWDPIYEVRQFDDLDQSPAEGVPVSLQNTPELDAWIRINTDETITVFTGKVEFGQGIKTAVAQIAAEELDVSLQRLRVAVTDTVHSPNEGMTVGSMSMETSGKAVRVAAAEARAVLLSIAFEELEAPIERLTVKDGTITDPETGRSITYWELFGGQKFSRQITGIGQPKRPQTYTIVGQPATRLDLLHKVTGVPSYVHDLDLPGMVHGRVVRPPGIKARLIAVDEAAIAQMPGVLKVVRDGSFLGVVAEREEQAVKAMTALRENATWDDQTSLPVQDNLFDYLVNQLGTSSLIVNGAPVDEPIPPVFAPAEAAHTVQATYYRPYHMHASLGPSAAVAHLDGGKLTVWTHSQGVYPPRTNIANVLGMAEEDVHVIHMDGAGCYGHNGADDVALDAALLARAIPGRPVSLKWMRADEHAWEPYGPAMAIKMQASVDADGHIIDWNHDVWSYSHLGRPRGSTEGSGLLAAWYLEKPFARPQLQPSYAPHVGSHRNADPLYAFPRRRVVRHFIPDSPLRTSSQRALGAYANVFAIESLMDELAFAAGADPVIFRLRHLKDERARAVIEAVAEKAGWQSGERPSANNGHGRGIAFAQYKNRQCYAAVVIDLTVDRDSGHIQLLRAVIAADAGQVVNPDGLSNQLEGGLVQAASWTLYEQVSFDEHGVTSIDWESYPILPFSNAPEIETVILNRPHQPFLGSGEATQGPTPAAIANAVFDAVGIRLRQIPFTPERVLAALDNQGE